MCEIRKEKLKRWEELSTLKSPFSLLVRIETSMLIDIAVSSWKYFYTNFVKGETIWRLRYCQPVIVRHCGEYAHLHGFCLWSTKTSWFTLQNNRNFFCFFWHDCQFDTFLCYCSLVVCSLHFYAVAKEILYPLSCFITFSCLNIYDGC